MHSLSFAASCAPAHSPSPALRPDEVVVGIGPTVAEELPRLADLLDLVQVEVADDELLLVRVTDVADELAARVDEVRLAVEVVVAQRLDARPG